MVSICSVCPEWSVPSRVRVYSSTRIGGVSGTPYDSLNLGLHVGDRESDVRANRALIVEALKLPSEPLWLNQVHGTAVIRLNGTDELSIQRLSEVASDTRSSDDVRASAEAPATADGAWTNNPDTVLTVLTADCLPVVISDQAGSAVAVIHAGWRGLAAGVLHEALAHFPDSSALHAWLGPAIGPNAFEVGEDVRQAFVTRDSGNQSAFKPQQTPGKYLADIYELARRDLNRARLVQITGGEHCTVNDSTRFHSHRRDGPQSGRMATFAWIDPAG